MEALGKGLWDQRAGFRVKGLGFRGLSLLVLLGGSWVVISRVISPLKGVLSIVPILITSLIAAHEPSRRV